MNLGLSCLHWLKWTCYSDEECFLGAAGVPSVCLLLQSEEFGECWDNNASQEKFFLCKLTASVLSQCRAANEPSLWNVVVAKVVPHSWENNITGPEESVQHMVCALAEDIGTLRGYKNYESKDCMGTKWSVKERESCMLLGIVNCG